MLTTVQRIFEAVTQIEKTNPLAKEADKQWKLIDSQIGGMGMRTIIFSTIIRRSDEGQWGWGMALMGSMEIISLVDVTGRKLDAHLRA